MSRPVPAKLMDIRPSKDTYFMRQLPAVAARSHDKHTQTSCKVVGPDGETRSDGYNGFPRGMEDDAHPERLDRPGVEYWEE